MATKKNSSKSNKLTTAISSLLPADIINFPEVADFFTKEIKLKKVIGIHIGLMSSDNLMPMNIDQRIVGIWLQCIDPSIPANEAIYAGLPQPVCVIGAYTVYLINPGLKHGSNTLPSSGRWISIKIQL